MRFAPLALSLLLIAACGEESDQTTTLSARFSLGQKQARLNLLELFMQVLPRDATTWPADQQRLLTEVGTVQSVVIPAISGSIDWSTLKVSSATLRVEGDIAPFDAVNLFVAPPGLNTVSDVRVVAIAQAAIPVAGIDGKLNWTVGGPAALRSALEGKLPGQETDKSFVLLLQAKAPVDIAPGGPLPDDTQGAVLFALPLRATP